MFRMVADTASDAVQTREALDGFWTLNNTGRNILVENQGFIRGEVNRIQEVADRTKRQLVIQAAVFIVAAFVLAVWFSRLISRPIREIEHAIKKLGKGDQTEPIRVAGPKDLHYLGM